MQPDLTNPRELKEQLARFGIRPERSAGQHFLCSTVVLEEAIAGLNPSIRSVTELGAGPGVLTLRLLAAGFHVRALERDQAARALLASLVPAEWQERLTLIDGDLRTEAWTVGDEPWQLAGNIPYNLSGYIIRRTTQLSPARAVLLVQKEVGQRMCAGPPQLSLLGLAVQLWGKPRRLRAVPRGAFWPPPAVDSMLVQIVPHASGIAREERERVLAYARPLFAGRRKQIGGSLRRSYALEPAMMRAVLTAAGIAEQQRPQEVPVAGWVRLGEALVAQGLQPPSP